MRLRYRTLAISLLLFAVPVAALGQTTEPYSGGTVPDTTLPDGVQVLTSGLSATFSVAGAGECTWDFGDGESAVGNPISHTYSEAGTFDVSADCGTDTFNVSVAVGPLPRTGTDATALFYVGGALLLAGAATVLAARRAKS